MSEIPEDIMKMADSIYCGDAYTEGDSTPMMIARGMMAERERCTKIATTLGVYPELNVFNGGPEWYRHGKDIANAIRTQRTQSEK